jgi:predicted CoA-substrate-specific enzyme activase
MSKEPVREGGCSGGRQMSGIVAGVDVGHRAVKVVLLDRGEAIAQGSWALAGSVEVAAEAGLERASAQAGLRRQDLSRIFVTGAGRERVPMGQGRPTEMLCHVGGAHAKHPPARTVIDMGAEGIRVLTCDPRGNLTGFILNDKCASGTGVFLETVASMLRVSLEEMGPLSLLAAGGLSLTTTCAVFAESEIVAEIHRGTRREEILRAVHDAIAVRVEALSRRMGAEPDVVLTGGVARNAGVVAALGRRLGMDPVVPEAPEMMGALGAALLAQEADAP